MTLKIKQPTTIASVAPKSKRVFLLIIYIAQTSQKRFFTFWDLLSEPGNSDLKCPGWLTSPLRVGATPWTELGRWWWLKTTIDFYLRDEKTRFNPHHGILIRQKALLEPIDVKRSFRQG